MILPAPFAMLPKSCPDAATVETVALPPSSASVTRLPTSDEFARFALPPRTRTVSTSISAPTPTSRPPGFVDPTGAPRRIISSARIVPPKQRASPVGSTCSRSAPPSSEKSASVSTVSEPPDTDAFAGAAICTLLPNSTTSSPPARMSSAGSAGVTRSTESETAVPTGMRIEPAIARSASVSIELPLRSVARPPMSVVVGPWLMILLPGGRSITEFGPNSRQGVTAANSGAVQVLNTAVSVSPIGFEE